MSERRSTQEKHQKLFSRFWLFIPGWMLFIIILGQTSFMNNILGSIDNSELSAWIMNIVLLAPIALISSLLTFRMDLGYFAAEKSSRKSFSILQRGLFSFFATAIVLIVSWYIVIFAAFAIFR